jgi:alkylated DNA repair dioxygenase AlkB
MSQFDLFGISEDEKELFQVENGQYIFIPNFFSIEEGNYLFSRLDSTVSWKQEKMNMYGKEVLFPRLTAWYGDSDRPYSFSGITLTPLPWTDELLQIKRKIETKTSAIFNSVLLNKYRDGSDSISWHTDAEKELGQNPIIASVTFGGTRNFQLRHSNTGEKITLELSHGSLLIMQGELQHFWQHQIPKTKKKVDPRINLTFRVIN